MTTTIDNQAKTPLPSWQMLIYLIMIGFTFISMPKNKISMSQSRSFTVDTEINEYSTEYTCGNTDDDYLLAA